MIREILRFFKKDKEENIERCVVCHCKLESPRNLDITLRPNYIIGAGEICDSCKLEVYGVSW